MNNCVNYSSDNLLIINLDNLLWVRKLTLKNKPFKTMYFLEWACVGLDSSTSYGYETKEARDEMFSKITRHLGASIRGD